MIHIYAAVTLTYIIMPIITAYLSQGVLHHCRDLRYKHAGKTAAGKALRLFYPEASSPETPPPPPLFPTITSPYNVLYLLLDRHGRNKAGILIPILAAAHDM